MPYVIPGLTKPRRLAGEFVNLRYPVPISSLGPTSLAGDFSDQTWIEPPFASVPSRYYPNGRARFPHPRLAGPVDSAMAFVRDNSTLILLALGGFLFLPRLLKSRRRRTKKVTA